MFLQVGGLARAVEQMLSRNSTSMTFPARSASSLLSASTGAVGVSVGGVMSADSWAKENTDEQRMAARARIGVFIVEHRSINA